MLRYISCQRKLITLSFKKQQQQQQKKNTLSSLFQNVRSSIRKQQNKNHITILLTLKYIVLDESHIQFLIIHDDRITVTIIVLHLLNKFSQ